VVNKEKNVKLPVPPVLKRTRIRRTLHFSPQARDGALSTRIGWQVAAYNGPQEVR